jgi:hypothetical protein
MAAQSAAVRATSARIAALTRWSQQDTTQGTSAARSAFLAKFEQQVDPDGVLTPQERAVRAERARKAYMAQLSLRAARARRERRAA